MQQENNNLQVTETEFEQEFLTEAKPSVDTSTNTATPQVDANNGGAFRMKGDTEVFGPGVENEKMVLPSYTADDAPDLMSFVVGGDTPAGEKREEEQKPLDKKVVDEKLEWFLTARDFAQSSIGAFWADADDSEMDALKYTPAERELLKALYRPIFEKHGDKIPWWAEALVVEGMTTGMKARAAIKIRKQKREAERQKHAVNLIAPASRPIRVQSLKPRRNFKIDDDGFYIKDVNGVHIKIPDRTEKANLKDAAELIFHNSWPKIRDIFGLVEDWPEKNGIQLDAERLSTE